MEIKIDKIDSWQQLPFYFYVFLLSPVVNTADNHTCIKYKSEVFGWKEISCVDVTWDLVHG